jgi:hypothetical protein
MLVFEIAGEGMHLKPFADFIIVHNVLPVPAIAATHHFSF